MSAEAEILRLRLRLDDLAADGDEGLARYTLVWPPMPPGAYWRVRWLAGLMLRCLESAGFKKADPWPANLKQAAGTSDARPLLIWGIGADRSTLREACRSIPDVRRAAPGLAPVLVTDIAEFASFSRLGCLVEYLPALSGQGEAYEKRKARMLARLYRGAPLLTVRAVLESASRPGEIRRLIDGQGALRVD
jgi:hypothetical protein